MKNLPLTAEDNRLMYHYSSVFRDMRVDDVREADREDAKIMRNLLDCTDWRTRHNTRAFIGLPTSEIEAQS